MNVNLRLIEAVRGGRLEEVKELINSYGLWYSNAWGRGYVLLCDALMRKRTAIVKLLLTRGSRVRSSNPSHTPLHYAVSNGDIDIIQMILDKGADVNHKNKDGRTPLHFSIEKNNLEVTNLLLKYGANVFAKNNVGESVLHFAVELGCLKTIEQLLTHGAPVNVDIKAEDGTTPLHVAAKEGFVDIAKYLLDYGACIHSLTLNDGYSPLHFASELGNEEAVKLFLNRGADINSSTNDNLTPLHIATKTGHITIVMLLLQKGAKVDNQDKDGKTALHFASELGNEDAVKLFLNGGADINSSTNDNLTPLHIATKTGRRTIVMLLLQNGAKVDNQDKDGKTALHLAVEKGYFTIVEDILNYCPDINHESSLCPLKVAVHGYGGEYKKIVDALLEYGFNVKLEDANDQKLLHNAIEKESLKIIEDLLKYGADVNTVFNCNSTPLHMAVKNKQEKIAKLLLSYKADVNAQDKSEKTPIYYAIRNDDLKITNLLLTYKADIKNSPDLLNIAVEKEYIEIVEALLQNGADINARDKDGRTALHFTALSQSRYFTTINPDIKGKIAKLLLSKGANVDARTENGETTLHAAAKKGYTKVIEALLKYNGVRNEITELHLCTKRRKKEICTSLFNKRAYVNAKQNDGATALHIAAEYGYKEVVKILLEYGAEIDSKIKIDLTLLHMGAQKVDENSLESWFSRDYEDGMTALHIACRGGHFEVVRILLDYGSDINIRSGNNHTALDYVIDGMNWFYKRRTYESDFYNPFLNPTYGVTASLNRHIVKVKTANLYLNEEYLNEYSISIVCKFEDFQIECKEEIASMKIERINNFDITFYDILTKGISSLARYMRNENIVEVLKLDDYQTKFPIYATMIKSNFRKGMERKELLEQEHKIFYFLFNNFPEFPYDCTERVISYLNNEDLKILMEACKPLNITNPDIIDVVIT